MSDLNNELKLVKASELFGLTNDIITHGGLAWITVTGNSMFPFLKDGRDSVELARADYPKLKRGDIVLIKRANDAFVLHRVQKVRPDCFYMIGDAQQWVEGPLKPEQLQAVVARIKRKGRVISCKNLLLRFLVFVWLLLTPIRPKLLGRLIRVKKLAKKIFRI